MTLRNCPIVIFILLHLNAFKYYFLN